MKISTELRLAPNQYFPAREHKDLIVLHHTVGGSAKSTVDYWQSAPEPIGTAYVVDRDGTVFEIFPPDCWAYHIGLKGRSDIERRSIGIEIASEGALCSDDSDRLYCFDRVSYPTRYSGPVFDFGSSYRGYRYFAQYTAAALASVSALVDRLLTVYSIPRQTPADHTRGAVAYADYSGVLAHCHLREDKTDVHPGFAWDELVANCQLELSGTRAAVAAAGVR